MPCGASDPFYRLFGCGLTAGHEGPHRCEVPVYAVTEDLSEVHALTWELVDVMVTSS